MFSNPIKRLGESLAQAQEQARQQLAKQQRSSTDHKPSVVFDNDKEEGTFTNGDESKAKNASQESSTQRSEEGSTTSASEKKDELTLPKEVRIKLAKLAKYEDRHPKLQAAYKESQGRIANFEKALRERTPLGSIDEVDDFANYLSTLSMRTNMSLEELKRVTEARNVLESELTDTREKHQEELASRDTIIADLRKRVEEYETKAEDRVSDDLTAKVKSLEEDLATNAKALQDANQSSAIFEKEISDLNEQINLLTAQVTKGETHANLIENLTRERDDMSKSLTTLQKSLDDLVEARKQAEAAIELEKSVANRRIAELEQKNRELSVDLARASLQMAPEKVKDVAPDEMASSEITQIESQDAGPATSKNKKKKKKKKAGTATASTPPIPTPSEPTGQTTVLEDSYPTRMLEEYLGNLSRAINSGQLDELPSAASQLLDGTDILGGSPSRGVSPMQLGEIKANTESLSKTAVVELQVSKIEDKLTIFANKFTDLVTRIDTLRKSEQRIQAQLDETESDLQAHRGLVSEKTRRIEAADEEIEQLREMLRDVGSDLVEAKDKIKELEQKINAKEAEKVGLNASVMQLNDELKEMREATRSLDEMRGQLTEADDLAATRLTELQQASEKLTAVETELVMLKSELGTVSADKNDFTAKLADAQTKLRQLERSEKEARESTSTAQNNLATKEQELNRLKNELNELQSVKGRVDDILRSTKQALFRVEGERNESQQREQSLRQESARFKRDADAYREKIVTLESLCTSLKRERDSLAEELQVKTTQLESAQTFMQNLREQTSEMGHRAREAKDRCEALEEELSEAHRLLTERAREATTMRRLLDEAEGREAGRVKQAVEKLDAVLEERDRLEEEIAVLRRTNAEGSGVMTKTLREQEHSVKDLSAKYENALKTVKELTEKNADLTTKLQEARVEANEAIAKVSRLSEALEETTVQTQQLQQERNVLKDAAEESQIRVEQLQRTQRHLSEELKRLRAEKRAPLPSPRDSRVSLMESRSPTTQTPRQSISSSSNTADPSKAAIDKEYLKNVLLQFFEHKDKRAQLLPVLSMLLNFSKAEEMKLLK